MSLHGGTWKVHASALDNEDVIRDALDWLSDGQAEITTENYKSALGAPMSTIVAKMNGKKAKKSFGKMGQEVISELLENGIEDRIDEQKVLHLRLGLAELTSGEVKIATTSSEPIVKGLFKLEVYPGETPAEVAVGFLEGV